MIVAETTRTKVTFNSEGISYGRFSFAKRARIRQIQFCARCFGALRLIPAFCRLLQATRELPIIRNILASTMGYNRPFATLRDAERAVAAYAGSGHSDPALAVNLMARIDTAKPSDYPALFFLQGVTPFIRTVFDFGGNVGNLFYCYSKYLEFSTDLVWTVYDVQENVTLGEQIASDSDEGRLRFTTSLSDGDGADLFIATGALHYFDRLLPEMIAEFEKKPRYVLVNRTPLVDGPPLATVQDGGPYRVACMLYNRNDLIKKFADNGYEMVEGWSAVERSLIIPCYPDRSVYAYSGMFFRLRDGH